MIPEIGHFALAMACAIALAQAVLPIWGAHRSDSRLMAMAPSLALAQLLALGAAAAALVVSSVGDDFTVLNVAENSHTLKPLLYKITGTWGNHEGSILLWGLILGLCGGAVATFGRGLPSALRARVIGVLGGTSAGFLLFCLLASDPFARLWPPPIDGRDMNPLLQDPGLAFHPPILYAGYVGFAVPFAFAVAALLEGRIDAAWGRWVRPWTVASWCLLTSGIALGSWWAYYELGWGCFWFWDPVENASLLPWLTGTALLHSAIVVEKREALKVWTVLLAIGTFSLSLSGHVPGALGHSQLGTLLRQRPDAGRVHPRPTRTRHRRQPVAVRVPRAGAGAGRAVRADLARGRAGVQQHHAVQHRRGGHHRDTVSADRGLHLRPQDLGRRAVLQRHRVAVGDPGLRGDDDCPRAGLETGAARAGGQAAVVGGDPGGAGRVGGGVWRGQGAAGAGLRRVDWIVFGAAAEIVERIRLFRMPMRQSWSRLVGLRLSVWGTALGHAGMGVTVAGIAGMSMATERVVALRPGEAADSGGYNWKLVELHDERGPNYLSRIATVEVTKDGAPFLMLHPSRRTFSTQRMTTTEAAIYTNGIRDLYTVLGEERDGVAVLRLHDNFLAPWIWLGALIMASGGALSLLDRRARVGAPARAAARPNAPSSGQAVA